MKRLTAIVLLATACAEPGAPIAPDRAAPDAPAERPEEPADASVDAPSDGSAEASLDASLDANVDTALDARSADAPAVPLDAIATEVSVPPDVPRCPFDVVRPSAPPVYNGYIRFINLARGVGTVRFIARNQPVYRPAYVESVVPEGASSGHIEMLAVNYAIHVVRADMATPGATVIDPLDGGIIPMAPNYACDDPPMGAALTPTRCAGVYSGGGCTLVLMGSTRGDGTRPTDLRIWNLADLPGRIDGCTESSVRIVSAYADGPTLDVTAGSTELARALEYRSPTGSRRVAAGPFMVSARATGSATTLGSYALTLNASHGHTLFLWGDARDRPGAALDALLVDDVPLFAW